MHFDVYFDKIWYKNDRLHIHVEIMMLWLQACYVGREGGMHQRENFEKW